jgi:hypothetical protein
MDLTVRANLVDLLIELGMAPSEAAFEYINMLDFGSGSPSLTGLIGKLALMDEPERLRSFNQVKERIDLLVPFMVRLGYFNPLQLAIRYYDRLRKDSFSSISYQGVLLVALGVLREEDQDEWLYGKLTVILGSEDDSFERGVLLARLVLNLRPELKETTFLNIFHLATELAGTGVLRKMFQPTKNIDFGEWAAQLLRRQEPALHIVNTVTQSFWKIEINDWAEYDALLLKEGLTSESLIRLVLNNEYNAYKVGFASSFSQAESK